MKKFSKTWYRLDAYAVMGNKQDSERDARIIVTKSNIRQAGRTLAGLGFGDGLRFYKMGQIKDLSASQAQEVNTLKADFF